MKSLKTKLITFISIILCGGLVTLSFISYLSASSMLKSGLERAAEAEAQRITKELDVFLQQRKAVVETLAKMAVENHGNDQKQLAFLRKAKADMQMFETVAYSHDISGKQTMTDVGKMIDVSDRSYVKAVAEGKTVVMDPVFSKVTGHMIVIVAAPMMRNGKPIGFVSAGIPIAEATKKVADFRFGKTGYAGLFGYTGLVISHPKTEMVGKQTIADFKVPQLVQIHEEMKKGKHGFMLYTIGGVEKLGAYASTADGWGIILGAPTDELYAPVYKLRNISIIITLTVIVIGAFFMYWVARSITRPIQRLNRAFFVLSSGDLTHRAEVKGNDELAQLATSFNRTTENLEQLIRNVSESSRQVAASAQSFLRNVSEAADGAEEITRTMNEVASGSQAQLVSIQESAQAMQGMTEGIQRISESAASVTDSSEGAVKNAESGNRAIRKATEQMDRISEVVQNSATVVKNLGERSKEISNIVEVITSIAAQTNLLALNAAIEAARAGENGRGFAVVADEVRKLAEQSGESAGQIVNLIKEIQKETEQAVQSMQQGVEEVQAGIEVVNEAGKAFDVIVGSSQQVASEIKEVSLATEEMSAASQQVMASVEELRRMSREAAHYSTGVEQTTEKQLEVIQHIATAARELEKTAISLQDSVNRFTI